MVLSTLLQNRVVLFPTSEPHGPLSIYLLQNLVVLPFTSEPRGLLSLYFGAAWSTPSFRAAWSPPHLLWSRVVSSFLWLPGLGLNPSAHLPMQPHF